MERPVADLREAHQGRLAPHRLEDPRGIGVAGEECLEFGGIALAGHRIGVSASVAARNSSGVRAKKAGS